MKSHLRLPRAFQAERDSLLKQKVLVVTNIIFILGHRTSPPACDTSTFHYYALMNSILFPLNL
jgi:hypothetical protein